MVPDASLGLARCPRQQMEPMARLSTSVALAHRCSCQVARRARPKQTQRRGHQSQTRIYIRPPGGRSGKQASNCDEHEEGRAGVHELADTGYPVLAWSPRMQSEDECNCRRPAVCSTAFAIASPFLRQRRETTAVPSMPSARAAPFDRSMHRPFTNGPRSFMRTVMLRPVECEVTMT